VSADVAPVIRGDLFAARFRASPRYELVLFDRLRPDEQARLNSLRADPDLYGILRPRDSSATIKSVGRDTALLFLTLLEAGPLPGYVHAAFGAEAASGIAKLVIDGVLEIEDPEAGVLVSGPDAYRVLYGDAVPETSGDRLSELSIAALRYAEALNVDDVGKLSARLYFYNKRPASSRWLRQLPDEDSVSAWLGLDGAARTALREYWLELPVSEPYDSWRAWRRRDGAGARRAAAYKLYVSPDPEALPDRFAAIVHALGAGGASRFKIGRDVYGVLRPDKLVAYFDSLEEIEAVVERLEPDFAGCPSHGVPFTAGLRDDGALSWGVDPPRGVRTPGLQEQESWRLWLTNRLAVALRTEAESGRRMAPWRFAMSRVALEGVDTTRWTPSPSLWRADREAR
jgi:hypothetical protein